MTIVNKNSKSRLTAILCGFFVLSALSVSRAVDIYWINPDGGDFSDAANWDPAQVPGADDRALFDIAPPDHYTVTWSEPITNKDIHVRQGNLTWDLGGHLYCVVGAGTYPAGTFGVVGNTLNITIQNGELDIATSSYRSIVGNTTVRIAPDITGNIGRYSSGIQSGSRLIVDGAEVTGTRFSTMGNGELIVTNGAYLNAGSSSPSWNPGGIIHVVGENSRYLSALATINIASTGLLYIAHGAWLSSWGGGLITLTNNSHVVLDNGTIYASWRNHQSYIDGRGVITGYCHNAGGWVRPGGENGIGQLTFTGTGDRGVFSNQYDGISGTIEIELAGSAPEEYDCLKTSGMLYAAGTLDIKLINGFRPVNDDVFVIFEFGSMEGEFDTINLPGDPKHWNLSKLYTEGEISFYRPHGTIFSVY